MEYPLKNPSDSDAALVNKLAFEWRFESSEVTIMTSLKVLSYGWNCLPLFPLIYQFYFLMYTCWFSLTCVYQCKSSVNLLINQNI